VGSQDNVYPRLSPSLSYSTDKAVYDYEIQRVLRLLVNTSRYAILFLWLGFCNIEKVDKLTASRVIRAVFHDSEWDQWVQTGYSCHSFSTFLHPR
jgi:hypothetical protein